MGKQEAEKQRIAKIREMIEKKKQAKLKAELEEQKKQKSTEGNDENKDDKKMLIKSYTTSVQHKKLYDPEKEARLQIMKSKSDMIDYKIGELQHKLLWAELDAGLFGKANERSRLVKRKSKSDFDRNIKQLETTKKKLERRYWRLKKRKRSEGSELSRKSRRRRLRRRGLKKSKKNKNRKHRKAKTSSSTRRRRRKNRNRIKKDKEEEVKFSF